MMYTTISFQDTLQRGGKGEYRVENVCVQTHLFYQIGLKKGMSKSSQNKFLCCMTSKLNDYILLIFKCLQDSVNNSL